MSIRALTVALAVCAAMSSVGTATAAAASSAPPSSDLVPLVSAVSERLSIADAVAAAKWGTGKPIDDPAREAEVLRAVAEQARGQGLDPARVTQIFRDQIEASKDVQRGLFAYWGVVPQAVPEPRPDLAAVRPVLDRLNAEIVTRTDEERHVLAGPRCLSDLVAGAAEVVGAERPDALHQAGLVRALRSVCGAVSG
ncbi:chorismate mutase [Rhodococcus hoagii]|nr:chorismate mutase [Prescottella equi]NKR60718.1 chorismate mutase [Prescottella equi]NKR68228.1 chorismate mutase [Prescottella equi]NKS23372.1 chorismate mutase [Prescottella equi]NKT05988.1 chorismate mutase [Prescottella equi]